MIEAPCKDCKNREIPKTCEKNCEMWHKYRKELEKEREVIFNEKNLAYEIKASQKRRQNFYGNR